MTIESKTQVRAVLSKTFAKYDIPFFISSANDSRLFWTNVNILSRRLFKQTLNIYTLGSCHLDGLIELVDLLNLMSLYMY